mmetsp:Transcript_40926/g.119523  ORF Transcript_40926/g.119523 Transcript_40926/m.119523 type:complete len:90 (+) Transcript_40926:750-1019(+)
MRRQPGGHAVNVNVVGGDVGNGECSGGAVGCSKGCELGGDGESAGSDGGCDGCAAATAAQSILSQTGFMLRENKSGVAVMRIGKPAHCG